MISKNFSEIEWQCKCGCRQMIIVPELVTAMQVFRNTIKKPVIVHCVNRCSQHNKNVGGVPNSRHIKGEACDFHVLGLPITELHDFVLGNNNLFNGIGFYKWGCHVDVGLKRIWWDKNE
jgi:uncharacterized protein YcbK (DUF882 family)